MRIELPEYKFSCPCCGVLKLSPDLIPTLQKALAILEFRFSLAPAALSVLSGYRCPDHNKAVGGAPHSFHLTGLAADTIPIVSNVDDSVVLRAWFFSLVSAGFNGVGLTSGFSVHADLRPFASGSLPLPQLWAPESQITKDKKYFYLLP